MALGHVCAVLGFLVGVGSVVASTGKAYYCRDPDTGKLHAVNSTWESKSFCGNYTCKIRKRNLTETDYGPIRQINITNLPEHTKNYSTSTKIKKLDPLIKTSGNKGSVEDPQLGIIPMDDKTVNNAKYYNEKPSKVNQANDMNKYETGEVHNTGVKEALSQYYQNKVTDAKTNLQNIRKNKDDRFLTEHEIRAISDILHSVKRSELDAIVDIYNLAQEIYNEMDIIATTPATDTPGEEATNANTIADDKSSKQEPKSYWYEPYYKGMNVDDHATSQVVTAHSTAHPKKSMYSFFTGPASSDEDFRRLPYHYHSQSNPHESASYFIEQPTTAQTEFPKPCKKKHINNFQIQHTPPSSYLLPYPFAYIHQYHLPTDYPKGMLYNIPYTWDYYNRVKKIPPYTGYIGDIAGTHTNPQLQEMPIKQGPISLEPVEPVLKPVLEQKTMEHIKAVVQEQDLLRRLIMKTLNKEQDWQREQHSSHNRLTDARAKLNNTNIRLRKSHPLTKKITLENIGRLPKLDNASRKKRSAEVNRTPEPIQEEEGLYETFLERTTCPDQIVPGFFRVGNLTQAYPACCPQLIRTR